MNFKLKDSFLSSSKMYLQSYRLVIATVPVHSEIEESSDTAKGGSSKGRIYYNLHCAYFQLFRASATAYQSFHVR